MCYSVYDYVTVQEHSTCASRDGTSNQIVLTGTAQLSWRDLCRAARQSMYTHGSAHTISNTRIPSTSGVICLHGFTQKSQTLIVSVFQELLWIWAWPLTSPLKIPLFNINNYPQAEVGLSICFFFPQIFNVVCVCSKSLNILSVLTSLNPVTCQWS